MADTTTHPIDPDRASATIALNTARDLVIQAAGVIADSVIDLIEGIAPPVLDNPMPDGCIRTTPRVVKRAIFKHNAKGTVNRTGYKATISIDITNPADP